MAPLNPGVTLIVMCNQYNVNFDVTSKRLNFRKSHSNLVLIGSYREVHPSLDIVWSEQSGLNLVTLYGPLTLFEWGAPKCPPPFSWLWYIRLKETEVGLDLIYYNHYQQFCKYIKNSLGLSASQIYKTLLLKLKIKI